MTELQQEFLDVLTSLQARHPTHSLINEGERMRETMRSQTATTLREFIEKAKRVH